MIYSLPDQILIGIKYNLYHTSLFTALTLPDIGGAIDSINGEASGKKYIKWFDDYVVKKFKQWNIQYIDGEMCYNLRCGLLHQGKSIHKKIIYKKISFIKFDKQLIAYAGVLKKNDNSEIFIDINKFCIYMVEAFYEWLEKVEETEKFKNHSKYFLNIFNVSFK